MTDRDELRDQLLSAFEDADYPVSGPMQLVPALPDGPRTSFETDDFSMTALELNSKLDGDFPYENPESFVDDIMVALDDQGYI